MGKKRELTQEKKEPGNKRIKRIRTWDGGGDKYKRTKIRSDKPGRRCVAWSSIGDGGALMVFVDTKSNKNKCFLWNPCSQIKVKLPCLPHSLDTFLKCCIIFNKPSQRLEDLLVHYKIIFYFKNISSFIWCYPIYQSWKVVTFSHNKSSVTLACDAVSINRNLYAISSYGLFYNGSCFRDLSPNPSYMYDRRLVVNYGIGVGGEDQLFQVQRKAQCEWEVWKLDLSNQTKPLWESIPNLDGKVIFLIGNYSGMYPHRPDIGLEGNCIFFTNQNDDDDNNFYVFSLGDRSLSAFKNKPNSGLPVWFTEITKHSARGMQWLRFKENGPRINVIVAEADDIAACENLYSQIELPADLVKLVAASLDSVVDYANFRAVCRNWGEIARPICWKPQQLARSSSNEIVPWLMLFNDNKSYSTFIDPTCNMKYHKRNNRELLSDCKICYSNDGWLLVTRGKTMFFFEPFSETKISLCDIPYDDCEDSIAFTSSPTSLDWVVFATCTPDQKKFYVAHLRSGDEKWTLRLFRCYDTFVSCGCSPVFHDDEFYFLGRNGNLLSIGFKESRTQSTSWNTHESIESLSNSRRGFLVSSGNELYTIVVGLLGKFVCAYKREDNRWVEVKSLENFSFFISQTSSFAIPLTKATKKNSINFPLFVEDRCLYYKLDTSEFMCNDEKHSSAEGIYERKEYFSGTWVQPRLVRSYR